MHLLKFSNGTLFSYRINYHSLIYSIYIFKSCIIYRLQMSENKILTQLVCEHFSCRFIVLIVVSGERFCADTHTSNHLK